MNAFIRGNRFQQNIFKQLISRDVPYRLCRAFASSDEISIPNRIHRGPTDILRALESTIGRDPSAAHYKYQDDPYMIPTSNITKRVYAMSQESGRKAAHWVRAQNPQLFNHKEACPEVSAFLPQRVYGDNVTEADLLDAIKMVRVSDAMQVYTAMKDKGQEISIGTQEDYLEMLCYCNNVEVLSEDFIEERWFKQSGTGKERVRKTWQDGGLAEELFVSITTPSSRAYSAIIRGMCKHYQAQRAHDLYTEACDKGLPLHTGVYNGLISCANFMRENFEQRWRFIADLLQRMRERSVAPNLGTLNATLEMLSIMGTSANTKQLVLRTLREMRMCGVEPSLGSWYYVLVAYCKQQGPISTILHDILLLLENKEHFIQSKVDVNFFVTAMDVCSNHLKDKELAKRLHKLLLYKNNYDLIGDSYKESIYYRHYFVTLCCTESLEDFMTLTYEKLVPHMYVPEPGVMQEILTAVEINDAAQVYLPRLWSDIKIFDHTNRERILEMVLDLMMNTTEMDTQDTTIRKQFADIAWDIWLKIEMQPDTRIKKLSFTGDMLGTILTLTLRNDDFEKACEIMNRLDSDQQSIAGIPKIEALALFVNHCSLRKLPTLAINCIQYCSDCGYPEAESLAKKLNEELTLDETHLNKLSKVVGEHVGKKSPDNINS